MKSLFKKLCFIFLIPTCAIFLFIYLFIYDPMGIGCYGKNARLYAISPVKTDLEKLTLVAASKNYRGGIVYCYFEQGRDNEKNIPFSEIVSKDNPKEFMKSQLKSNLKSYWVYISNNTKYPIYGINVTKNLEGDFYRYELNVNESNTIPNLRIHLNIYRFLRNLNLPYEAFKNYKIERWCNTGIPDN